MLRRVIFFTLFMILSCAVQAQPGNKPLPQLPMPDASQDVVLPDSAVAVDTALFAFNDSSQFENIVSKKKERRLELPRDSSITITDTSNTSRIFRYNINRATNDVEHLGLDTSVLYFRTDYSFFRNDVGAFFLGNWGSPVMYYDYFKRKNDYDFIFQQPYEPYFFSPSNAAFFNTTTPYVLLFYDWTMGSKSQMEDQLRILFTQNITSKLNYVLEYNNMGTKGQYPRQHIKNRAFNLGATYLGNYYKANIGYIFNTVEAQESGGIVDDWLILDTIVDPQEQQARLQNGKNTLNNSRFYLTHSVDIPMFYFGNDSVINNVLLGRIGHSMEYSRFGKVYSDQGDTSYYANSFFDHTITRDSLGLSSFDNKLFMQLRPLRAYIFESLTVGFGYKSMHSYMFNPTMYLTGSKDKWLHTSYAYAKISGWYKQYFKWNVFADINLLGGYKDWDNKLGGDLTFSVYPRKRAIHLNVSAFYSETSPDVFVEKYSTNHYRWENFGFEKNAELRLQGKLSIPSLRCEVGAGVSRHTNFIYFAGTPVADRYGDEVAPKQHKAALWISAFTLKHNFEAAGFNFHHRALMQLSTNEKIISLPLFAASASYYYEGDLVKNVLRVQLGVDLQYATKFNGYGYNPSVGVFHTSQVQQGGHLWADAFIAFRWKSATPFFKYEHVAQGLINGNSNYFAAVHYPRNARVLKLGLSWKFFD